MHVESFVLGAAFLTEVATEGYRIDYARRDEVLDVYIAQTKLRCHNGRRVHKRHSWAWHGPLRLAARD